MDRKLERLIDAIQAHERDLEREKDKLTCDSWAVLRPKPGTARYLQGSVIAEGSVTRMLHQANAGNIKLPLRTRLQELPVVLPDKTADELPDDTPFPNTACPRPLCYDQRNRAGLS